MQTMSIATILKNKTFAKLYLSQAISLFGDAFSWVGIALLSYQIDPIRSPFILATALTLRVTAYIIFSPFAGVLADRENRKSVLIFTHLARMAVILCLPFVTLEIQIYGLVFLLNLFSAFFTPTFKTIIPSVVPKESLRPAIGLATATYQLLGILGPALAGFFAIWIGGRQIFVVDALSYLISAILIMTIPKVSLHNGIQNTNLQIKQILADISLGAKLLWGNRILKFALSIEFVAALAGAMILVNTITMIKTGLSLSDNYYGWLMGVFGLGAGVSAFVLGNLDKSKNRSWSLVSGSVILGLSIMFANFVPFTGLLLLWSLAGLGQTLAEMPSSSLIPENIDSKDQGKVYGSHFAFSHLWWAIAYPIAGYVGVNYPSNSFLIGGILTLMALLAIMVVFYLKRLRS